MTTEITQHIAEANRAYQAGSATEHTYRPALQRMPESIAAAQTLPRLKALRFTANVPPEAREFHIGGYLPAQKRLKDRKGRTLNHEDIEHYQKINCVLTETARVMGEIE